MKKTNLYIGLGFILFGVVMLFEQKVDESILYFTLGGAFSVTWVSFKEFEDPLVKKVLTVFSWLLIAFALFWFLYLVRTDAWR